MSELLWALKGLHAWQGLQSTFIFPLAHGRIRLDYAMITFWKKLEWFILQVLKSEPAPLSIQWQTDFIKIKCPASELLTYCQRHTGVHQEFLKHVIPAYVVRGIDLFRSSNKKMTTTSTISDQCE